MPEFIPGLKLSEHFYTEVIQPSMAKKFPKLVYSAARLGWGSDVMGFDTAMSMDHGWGPKMTLFLDEQDYNSYHQLLDDYFAENLPFTVHGFSTHFGEPLSDGGVMAPKNTYPIHHMITITTPHKFMLDYLGVDIQHPLTPHIWLTIPQQRLRTLSSGRIYYDGLEMLAAMRQQFHWYPQDLWLYLLANQWQRIDQDEPFMGRTGSVGDEIGSRLVASRLTRDIMHLAFLMEKQYAPYVKWFGTAFQKLDLASQLLPIITAIMDSQHWQERQSRLSKAYLCLADAHNALKLTAFIEPEISNFHERPFLVPHASRFVTALLNQIQDPEIRALPPRLGSIDQIVDNTEVLENNARCQRLRSLYYETNS